MEYSSAIRRAQIDHSVTKGNVRERRTAPKGSFAHSLNTTVDKNLLQIDTACEGVATHCPDFKQLIFHVKLGDGRIVLEYATAYGRDIIPLFGTTIVGN